MIGWRAHSGGCFWCSAFLRCSRRLALAFDPRYRDFPFAPLTCAAVPFLLIALLVPRSAGIRPMAEKRRPPGARAARLCIAINEGFANWQAVWCCAALAALAFSLARARDAQG